MVNKGTIPLGDFFIYPTQSTVNVMDGVLATESANVSTTSSADQTLPSCTFNLYLTSTNLIFQPVIRRLRIRRPRRTDFLRDRSKTGKCTMLLSNVTNSLSLKYIGLCFE